MSETASPTDLLASARAFCKKPGTITAGVWPRASALLARQAVELAMDSYWHAIRCPALTACPMRSQLICLAEVAGRSFAGDVAAAWASLSSACHIHPYELAPTAAELLGWIDAAERFCVASWPAAGQYTAAAGQ
jgi:hypothetical protein